MNAARELWSRLVNLFRRNRAEREMQEEMRLHLELETEQNLRRGLPADEARFAAQRAFGGVDQLQERERDARGFAWLHQTWQDLRHARRMMLKEPGFTAVVVLTLALGLSANITVFSIISFFFFKPLQVPDADRFVVLARQTEEVQMALPVSWKDFQDYADKVPEFEDALALTFRPVHVGVPGRVPDRTYIEAVSTNYFSMLGVQPLHGRLFLPGEGEHADADPVVVLGHDYWQSKLGGDPAIVGETIIINDRPFEVIGITPPHFTSVQWSLLPSAFVPATMIGTIFRDDAAALQVREWPMFKMYARLKPGATVEQARAAVAVIHQQVADEYQNPAQEKKTRVLVRPELLSRPDPSVAGIMPFAAAVFMALVLMVLLIACANVANLLFARALARQREMGIRSALGASRGRLTRQLLTESIWLALVAGAVGLALSSWSAPLLEQLAPAGDVPMKPDESWDWNSVWFTLAVSILAGVVMALIPALRATEASVQSVLKGAPLKAGRARHWFRSALVVAQVGFCVIVLVCGGLFIRSLKRSAELDLGFQAEGLLLASIDPGLNGYSQERGEQLVEEVVEHVRNLPGVANASIATHVPFYTGDFVLRDVRRAGDEALPPDQVPLHEVQAGINRVHRDHLATMGTTLLRGRTFTRQDSGDGRPVVVINETLAKRFWPDGTALGESIVVAGDGVRREIVGVVKDGKYIMLNEPPRAFVFAPLEQMWGTPLTLHVRTQGGLMGGVTPTSLVPMVREVLNNYDPNLPIFNVKTMEEHVQTSVFGYMPLRFAAALATVQGALGLLLAVMGIYGVVAYSVGQRTREIGVRVALGATPRDVLRLVMRGGLRLIVFGIAFGLFVAVGLSHAMAGLLYGLDPLDGRVFGSVILLLVVVSALACYLPARRALRVDPLVALRAE